MPIVITPYIPKAITVHLGPPDSPAENVTVSFPDYIKNVASSEIYPTWHISALRANILAQISFALNRVYTEFYPSRGYAFQITASTAYDQKFIKGRTIFQNISLLVDDIFTHYLRRMGFAEPLAAQFCNGTTSQCDGMSQWGSESMAQNGRNSIEILRHYYGSNIEIVTDAPVQEIQTSYPGYPLRRGDSGSEVRIAQIMLNRIALAYPAIPRLWRTDGIFGSATETSVLLFQRVFSLTPDGIIGSATWYQMVILYTGILRLSELVSEGQRYFYLGLAFPKEPEALKRGESVSLLQYLLCVLAQFYLTIPKVEIDGIYGKETEAAVLAVQKDAGLPPTGQTDETTWNVITERFLAIDETVLQNPAFFPFESSAGELSPIRLKQLLISQAGQYPGIPLEYGQQDWERSPS